MQNQNISSSSLSDASEIRYQKAVRQISKLIGTNNAIKKDADNFRIMCQNLQIQNQQLFQGYEQSVKQRHQVQQKTNALQSKVKELQLTIENLTKKQQTQLTQSMIEEEKKKHNQQIQICHDKLNEQGHNIILLEEFVAQLQKENKDLKISNQKLQSDLKKELAQKIKKVNIGDCSRCPQSLKKVQQATDWRQKIQEQNIQLKKKLSYIQLVHPQNMQKSSKPGHYKDYLITSLEQRIRNQNQIIVKHNIQINKKQTIIQRLRYQLQLRNQKAKQKTVETTTMLNGDSYKLK